MNAINSFVKNDVWPVFGFGVGGLINGCLVGLISKGDVKTSGLIGAICNVANSSIIRFVYCWLKLKNDTFTKFCNCSFMIINISALRHYNIIGQKGTVVLATYYLGIAIIAQNKQIEKNVRKMWRLVGIRM